VDLRSAVDSRDAAGLRRGITQVAAEIPKARAVILDLRGPAGSSYDGVLSALNGLLASHLIRAPAQRYLLHSGYRPQVFPSSGGYFSAFVNLPEEVFEPSSQSSPKRVVFVVRSGAVLPPVALALQAAGDGVIVAEGPVGDEGVVRTLEVDLGEGLKATVRITEIVPFDRWPGVHADVEVSPAAAAGVPDAALQEALTVASGTTPPRRPDAPVFRPLPEAVWRPDRRYTQMLDPTFEYRLLAVFRFWNVIHYFYPYRDLLRGWDSVLPDLIARMESARSGRDYALALAEMAARVQDGHTDLWGHPELSRLYGEAFVPIALRWIEGRYAVTAVSADPAVQASGAQVGDEVLAVDGQLLGDRLTFFSRYVSASNPAALREKIAPVLLGGPRGSIAILTVRGGDGRDREVKVPRGAMWNPEGSGDVVRLLPGNFGYMDLTRLTVDEVEAAFEKLRGSRGIVFDVRGYPRFTAWAIAAHLNVRGVRVGALFSRPLVSGTTDDEDEPALSFRQPLPVSKSPTYTGKTVMLIDERTVSQGEHTGLLLEAANGTRFVGAPTAGTNGDVTDFTLPGGIIVRFTGHDVRHADGRPLQRIGLLPDVEATPTLAGLRAGRDEVLERALRDLEEPTRPTPGEHHER
jgi:C-terminal processing protease CtpA/Prc